VYSSSGGGGNGGGDGLFAWKNQFSKSMNITKKYTIGLSFTVYNSKLTPCKQGPHRSSRTYSL